MKRQSLYPLLTSSHWVNAYFCVTHTSNTIWNIFSSPENQSLTLNHEQTTKNYRTSEENSNMEDKDQNKQIGKMELRGKSYFRKNKD